MSGCADLELSSLLPPSFSYQSWRGWQSRNVTAATDKWGPNAIIMPSPTFMELMADAILAPFFVFQVCFLLAVVCEGLLPFKRIFFRLSCIDRLCFAMGS